MAVTFIGGGNQSIRKNQTTMRFRPRMQLSKYDKGQKLCLLVNFIQVLKQSVNSTDNMHDMLDISGQSL